MSRLECWCVRWSSSPILKHLGHWAAGNLVSCRECKALIYKFCGMVNILDIPIFSCAMYHMAPKGETKTTCWTWWSLDSRISSWCFNQLEGHSFEVTVLDPTPATMSFPTWVAPCGVALHMWRRSLCCWPYFPGSGTPSLVIMVMAYVQLMHFDMWWYDYHVVGKLLT